MIQQQAEVLKPLILEIFEKSRQRFCVRKIRAKLMENDCVISERRIIRLMKQMGLSRKVLSYTISDCIDTGLVTTAFEKAFIDRHEP